jgi:hypothetical protein
MVALLLHHYLNRTMSRQTVPQLLLYAAFMIGVVLLPFLVWYQYIVSLNGKFFSFEVECCSQIVWMFEAWNAGPQLFGQLLAGKLGFFVTQTLAASLVVLVLAGFLTLVWLAAGRQPLRFSGNENVTITGALIITVATILFFSLIGYTVTRLAFGGVVPLIVISGVVAAAIFRGLQPAQRRYFGVATFLFAAAVAVIVVLKDGPYS